MPIKLPASLPAFEVLTREGVMVMSETRAARQDIRPLRIGLLNLMPRKIQTETQFARLIGATPLQIELTLIRMSEHETRNTAAEHMAQFYRPFAEVAASGEKLDGLIVTGAPCRAPAFRAGDLLGRAAQGLRLDPDPRPFDLRRLLGGHGDGPTTSTESRKAILPEKAFGLYGTGRWRRSRRSAGFSDELSCREPLDGDASAECEAAGMRTLLASDEVGPCLVEDEGRRALYIFNHLEYDSDTLKRNTTGTWPPACLSGAARLLSRDDPSRAPPHRWRATRTCSTATG
jgi:homoserine O-succinyltransferase